MLKEYPATQHKGEPKKRWFADDYFEIIIWLDNDSAISGFQLCYDKKKNERALTWTKQNGFRHDWVDGGETSPTKNRSPILTEDGAFQVAPVLQQFILRSKNMEGPLRSFIIEKLKGDQEF
jgi:hypothetical protein